jgi:hypothetical protein
MSFPAREPRNTLVSGPAADDPIASSSPGCQSMLATDSTQPEPVPITHGTPTSMIPSANSRCCASAAWLAQDSSTESSAVTPTSGGYIVACRTPKLATRSGVPSTLASSAALATVRTDVVLSENAKVRRVKPAAATER